MELRPPINFPLAAFDTARLEPEVDSWRWTWQLEEQLDYDLFVRDASGARRQRVVGRVRVVALITMVCLALAVVRLYLTFGVGIGLVAAWALPVVVLGVVLAIEKLFLRLSR